MAAIIRSFARALVVGGLVSMWACESQAAGLDPRAIAVNLPDAIHWVANSNGSETATLVGDPAQPGLYVELVKWKAHHNSRPHYHPNDRYITVLSGTWWVGTGADYAPDSLQPVPAGSFVTHLGKGVHYDGAKNDDAVIEIVGIGPATAIPVESH